MNFQTNKISRLSMRDRAYEIIKNAIISGELLPETRLKDKELSEQLGISRTPIREAMLRLEDEAFISSKPNSYTMVSPINLKEMNEIYKIVIALEKLALSEAINVYTEEELHALVTINEHYKIAVEKGDSQASLHYDLEFHQQLVKMSHNQELEKMLITLKEKVLQVESYYFRDCSPKQKSLDEHRIIINGFQTKTTGDALKAVEANWLNSLKSLLKID